MKTLQTILRLVLILFIPFLSYSQQDVSSLRNWPSADLSTDSVAGISLSKAHKLIKNKKGHTVIVAVIDGGTDIEHEDLKDNIWINKKEIPGNGKDDDRNGYADDINGWNFLGSENGDMYAAQLELTRLVKKYSKQLEKDSITAISQQEKQRFDEYNRLKTELLSTIESVNRMYEREVSSFVDTPGNEQKRSYIQFLEDRIRFHLNQDYDPREMVGDNPDDITDSIYGNNNVIGYKEQELHGTHVSGIIGAVRNNGKGIDGIAKNVKIMPLRAVPNGDEYDKDIALAIRYAVNNGARVINMSFGKPYSMHNDWVYDAIKYAENNDVLIVHGAGNESKNIDKNDNFPNDSKDRINEFCDNVITVGATTRFFNKALIASYSNYGKINVDIFAPGSDIYSSVPNNKYQFMSGTSMASPAVAGVAALIRSYYPMLTAKQVKYIIMSSGTDLYPELHIPGTNRKTKFIHDLSVTGKMLNAYNALLKADEE